MRLIIFSFVFSMMGASSVSAEEAKLSELAPAPRAVTGEIHSLNCSVQFTEETLSGIAPLQIPDEWWTPALSKTIRGLSHLGRTKPEAIPFFEEGEEGSAYGLPALNASVRAQAPDHLFLEVKLGGKVVSRLWGRSAVSYSAVAIATDKKAKPQRVLEASRSFRCWITQLGK